MTHRESFFSLLKGKEPEQVLFFPDITVWYMARRSAPGSPQRFIPGQFIPDDDPFHEQQVDMPERYRTFTLNDFYRRYDWGLPVHIYDWYDEVYNGVEKEVIQEGNKKVTRFRCPEGQLEKLDLLAADGSWAPREHLVKRLEDFKTLRYIISHCEVVPRYERIKYILEGVGEQGICDLVIWRSPFGKLIHEYLGLEKVTYALTDEKRTILDFLKFQEEYDLQVIRMAAEAPARLVIISDHADENLISPAYYREYCIPYYQKATDILHRKQKIVSTHLDGNFKGLFPYLGETGFDLLDGCTPAPMFNYEVEELAALLEEGIYAYCGIPATLFTKGLDDSQIIAFAQRIVTGFKGRVILNVGDILPPGGDIEQLIKVSEWVKKEGYLCLR